MKRDDTFYRDKALLALERERRTLWRRRAQTIEIDPPIPRGWVRHWRLTDKARSRHDAAILKTILLRIDNPRFHWRKSFEYGKHRKRRMVELTQGLCGIRVWEWIRLKWPDSWKRYFKQVPVNPGKSDQTFAYKFVREDHFELFVERHFVRRVRLLDPAAESRESEIDRLLHNGGGIHRLDNLLGCRCRHGSDPRQRAHARLAAQRIQKALRGDWEAEMSRPSRLLISASHHTGPFRAHIAQQQRHDVESVGSAGATPAVSAISKRRAKSEGRKARNSPPSALRSPLHRPKA